MDKEQIEQCVRIAEYLEQVEDGPQLYGQAVREIVIYEGGMIVTNIEEIIRRPDLHDATICTPWVYFHEQDPALGRTMLTIAQLEDLYICVKDSIQNKINDINATCEWSRQNPDEGAGPSVFIFGVEHRLYDIRLHRDTCEVCYYQQPGNPPKYESFMCEAKPATYEFICQLHATIENEYSL